MKYLFIVLMLFISCDNDSEGKSSASFEINGVKHNMTSLHIGTRDGAKVNKNSNFILGIFSGQKYLTIGTFLFDEERNFSFPGDITQMNVQIINGEVFKGYSGGVKFTTKDFKKSKGTFWMNCIGNVSKDTIKVTNGKFELHYDESD